MADVIAMEDADEASIEREVGPFPATYIRNCDGWMRRISLRSLQRRPPSHERCELSNHRHRNGQTRQQSTRMSILSESRSGLHDLLPETKDILADLNRSTSRVHLPLTTVSAQTQFGRVVSRMLNAAMATEPTGPTTRLYLTSTGLRKIEPYWYPYTTMAKGRWLGREMLEVVSTEFRDRSIDYYVSPSIFRPRQRNEQFPRSRPEICPRVRSDHHQRGDRQTRYRNPEW